MRKHKITAILLAVLLLLIAGLTVACNDDKGEENTSVTPIALTLDSGWKNTYNVGEAFSPCNMTVTYSDGNTTTVSVTADMISGFDTSTAGAKQVTISYLGLTTTLGIGVIAPAEVGKLSLDSWRSLYFVGDGINLSNASLVVDGADKAAVTADMVAGFDTSSAGLKTVRIIYDYAYIDVEIVVVNRPQGVAAGEKSQIDKETFMSELETLMASMGFADNMDSVKEFGIGDDMITFFEAAGITTEEFKGLIDTVMSYDAALPEAINQIMSFISESDFESMGEMINAIADAALKEEVLGALANTFAYIEGIFEPEDFVNMTIHLIKGMTSQVSWQNTINVEFYPLGFDSSFTVSDSVGSFDEAEIVAAFENAGLKDFYDGYFAGPDSDYAKIVNRINSAEAKIAATAVIGLLDTLSTYGVGTTSELLGFAAELTAAIMDGDASIADIFAGEKYSYKDLIKSVNLLGEIGSEVNRVLASDPAFVLAGATFVKNLLNIDFEVDGYEGDRLVSGIAALDKTVFALLEKITPELMSEVYLDYDDWAKESDETSAKQKFGYMCVKIINFAAEQYNTLTAEEKDDVAYCLGTAVPEIFDAEGLDGFLDILNGWSVKDADAYTAEELSAVADRVTAAVENTSFGGDRVEYTYVVSISFTDNIVEKGVSEQEIPVTVFMMHMYGNGGSSDIGYSSLAEFAAAGGEYTVTADFSEKGFAEVTLSVEDFEYGGNIYRGTTESITLYVYDDTSKNDFRQLKNSNVLVGVVIPQGADVGSEVALYQFSDLPWRFVHIETGIEVSDVPNLFGDGSSMGEFVGLDSSLPVGLYAAKLRYAHNIFGEVEIPIVYYICDPQSSSQTITDVKDYYANDKQLYAYADYVNTMPKGVECDFYGVMHYSYVIEGEKAEVVCEGFDPTADGVQTVTVYPEGYPQFAESFLIKLVEIESVTNFYAQIATNYNLQVPVNGDADDIYMYEFVANPEYASSKPFKATLYFPVTDEYGDTYDSSYSISAASFGEYVDILESLGITVTVEGLDSSTVGNYGNMRVTYTFEGTTIYNSTFSYNVAAAA